MKVYCIDLAYGLLELQGRNAINVVTLGAKISLKLDTLLSVRYGMRNHVSGYEM